MFAIECPRIAPLFFGPRWSACVVWSLAAFLAACAGAPPPEVAPPPVPDTVVVVDTVVMEVESGTNAALEQRVARLQLTLLEKDAQVEGLRAQLDAAYQEVVRTMAKLQSQASRAEAASGMAEAEIAVRDLRAAGGRQVPAEVAQATALLERSTAEFNQENYAGSLFLATQARTVAEGARGRLTGGGNRTVQPGEEPFAVPVPLRTLSRSNVREGPGTNTRVLFTLDPGVALTGQSHTDDWVRVTDPSGRTGWVFHTLVGNRE